MPGPTDLDPIANPQPACWLLSDQRDDRLARIVRIGSVGFEAFEYSVKIDPRQALQFLLRPTIED
jgi:hypothetical protein